MIQLIDPLQLLLGQKGSPVCCIRVQVCMHLPQAYYNLSDACMHVNKTTYDRARCQQHQQIEHNIKLCD